MHMALTPSTAQQALSSLRVALSVLSDHLGSASHVAKYGLLMFHPACIMAGPHDATAAAQ
jgi:hypothetical protein